MPSPTSVSEQARALMHRVGVRVREDLCVLQVNGDDARSWLNGQITNDLKGLEPGGSVYALAINVRGKIMADLWVLDRGTQLVLLVPRAALAAVLESFERQIIMEDVELLQEPDTRVLSAQGPLAERLLNETQPRLADVHAGDELGQGGRFVLVPQTQLATLLAKLTTHAQALGGCEVQEEGFDLARVRVGRGRFGQDFSEQHYPQEAGLKERAVSFSKGCYLGQEVVCTLENRGRLTRELTRLAASGEALPHVDDELRDGEGHAVGRLTSVVHDPDANRVLALGYVKRSAAAPGTVLHAGAVSLHALGGCTA